MNFFFASISAPWYISQSAFWAFSLMLLSWPLRLAIQMNVAQMNYQVVKLFGANSTVAATNSSTANESSVPVVAANATALSESSDNTNLLPSTAALGTNNSFPPSYSEAMLWPPTYSSLVLPQNYGESTLANNIAHNGGSNHNDSNLDSSACRSSHFQTRDQTPNDYRTVQQSTTSVGQNSSSWTSCVHLLSNERTEDQSTQIKPTSNWPLRSSVSCSLLHGQLVYLVNPLPVLLRNAGRPSANVERKQSNTSIDSNLNEMVICDQENQSARTRTDVRRKSDLNQLMDKLGNMKRSFTAQHVPQVMRQFSSQILTRIKSMHNLRPTEESILWSDVNQIKL